VPQGVPVVPQDQNGARFYGKLRRQQQNNWSFPASTTTPFSGNTPAGVKVWDAALSYAATQGATPTGEFELAEIHGVQLILANNNSGQTLSGITLTDWDEAPSSGLAIPGQSYTTAINLATGASVTLSALNLASGSAIRLWVPINSASLRFLVVNPTYAAAVTAGTGSLETIAIPEYGTVQLSGSNVPNVLVGPTLLSGVSGTPNPFPYSDMPAANQSGYPSFEGLSTVAKKRTIYVVNTLNESWTLGVTGLSINSLGTGNLVGGGGLPTGITVPTNADVLSLTSEDFPGLAAVANTIEFQIASGATVATAGQIAFYVAENV
jgi:hypothetical protein